MGSSFTRFSGYGFWARDAGLEVWLYVLAREAGEVNSFGTDGAGSYFTSDLPVEVMTALGETFVRLVRGELRATAEHTTPLEMF